MLIMGDGSAPILDDDEDDEDAHAAAYTAHATNDSATIGAAAERAPVCRKNDSRFTLILRLGYLFAE